MIGFYKTFAITLVLTTSCKYLPNKTRSNANKLSTQSIYETDETKFVRDSSLTSGTLQFKLKGKFHCEVAYWANNPNITPNSSSPQRYKCPEIEGSEYRIPFDNLAITEPYTFEISAWPEGLDKSVAVSYRIKENPNDLKDIKIEKFYVLQFNHQTRSAKLDLFSLKQTKNLTQLKPEIEDKILADCGAANYLDSDDLEKLTIPITTVRSDGYLKTSRVSTYSKTKFFKFKDLDYKQDWELSFVKEGSVNTILLPKQPFIDDMKVVSNGKTYDINNFGFSGNIVKKKLESNKVNVSLTIDNSVSDDFILTQNINNSITCKKTSDANYSISLSKNENQYIASIFYPNWFFNGKLEIPLLIISSDQYITNLSI